MALVLKNNAISRLASSLAVGDTVLPVSASEGSRFPALAAGDWFPVTVLRDDGALEIMRCTARSGDMLTVVRAQESTTAKTFSAGDRVELRLTAGTFADGLVASVAGKSGAVTVEDLSGGGVATQSGTESLTNKTVSGPRSSMAQYIDKTITNAAATGTVTLDLSQADVFNLTLSGNTTLAISNAPTLSGETFAIVVRVSQGAAAFALTWFSGITWLTSGGTAPAAPAANKSVEYVLSTTDGTNWIGRKGAAN